MRLQNQFLFDNVKGLLEKCNNKLKSHPLLVTLAAARAEITNLITAGNATLV
ncbi:hypothetical protein YK48G_06910 [Lentilactobacillus fungorum]|uniref:Uncharacterized protein n=1 Tax=Lentilactobacillus fungorum TaxID=2201250 RepID=A0ABQ3VXV5_9LACO|nr:hypothetical protein YK48G_06910 [Lentilactobacillus fungorum]